MIAEASRIFAAKLNETTPRERAALAMLVAIAAIAAAVYAAEWANREARAASMAAQAASDNAALQSSLSDEAPRRELSAAAGRVWRASRRADVFAAEEIATEIEVLCFQAGLSDARVALMQAPPARGQVGAVEVSVAAAFDWASFLALLETLEASDLSVSIRSVDVSEAEGAQSLALVLSAPVIQAGGER